MMPSSKYRAGGPRYPNSKWNGYDLRMIRARNGVGRPPSVNKARAVKQKQDR